MPFRWGEWTADIVSLIKLPTSPCCNVGETLSSVAKLIEGTSTTQGYQISSHFCKEKKCRNPRNSINAPHRIVQGNGSRITRKKEDVLFSCSHKARNAHRIVHNKSRQAGETSTCARFYYTREYILRSL